MNLVVEISVINHINDFIFHSKWGKLYREIHCITYTNTNSNLCHSIIKTYFVNKL